jgi:hypothetical protein
MTKKNPNLISAVLNTVPEKDHHGDGDNSGNDDTDKKGRLGFTVVFHISQNYQTQATLPRPRQTVCPKAFL